MNGTASLPGIEKPKRATEAQRSSSRAPSGRAPSSGEVRLTRLRESTDARLYLAVKLLLRPTELLLTEQVLVGKPDRLLRIAAAADDAVPGQKGERPKIDTGYRPFRNIVPNDWLAF
jgi:hypothetical protein